MEFNDDYFDHCAQDVLYLPRNIPTRETENLYEFILEGCKCTDNCTTEICECAKKSGTLYEYEDVSNLETYKIKEKDRNSPTYECNSNCQCYERICGNRVVQYGPRKGLEVKLCTNINKGNGLFTINKINKEHFICEYAGEIITEETAKTRFQVYKNSNKMNYIFCINERFGDRSIKTFIDPTVYGNIGRYINHSCHPNCKLVIIREDSIMPVLAIFSKEDIQAGSEITFDYGEDSHTDEENSQKPCFCGEEDCRKYLPYDSNLK